MATDFLRKFLFESFPIKGSLVRLETSWQEVRARANPDDVVAPLLAQTLCSSVLLTSNIKFKGSVSLQIQSSGALKLLLGQCTHKQEIRGVSRMNENEVSDLLLEPVLGINLEPDGGGQPYQGIVALEQDDLALALRQYFKQSEQLASRFWLASGEDHCCGMMLQKMPGDTPDDDAWDRITELAATLSSDELLELDPETLLNRLFHQEDLRLFKPSEVSFNCKCSRERVAALIRSLGEVEARDIVQDMGQVEVKCEYCGQNYGYDSVDVSQLFAGPDHPLPENPGMQ